jgi:hypothetical protein
MPRVFPQSFGGGEVLVRGGDVVDRYSLAATLRSQLHAPFEGKWTCGTTTWIRLDLLHILVVESNLPEVRIQFPWTEVNTSYIHMKYPEDIDSEYWYLYVKCDSGDMFAMMGTTHSLVNETGSRRVLGQWLRSLNVTQWIGVDDFEYSSGSCLGGKLKEVTRIGLFVLAVAVLILMLIRIAKG